MMLNQDPADSMPGNWRPSLEIAIRSIMRLLLLQHCECLPARCERFAAQATTLIADVTRQVLAQPVEKTLALRPVASTSF